MTSALGSDPVMSTEGSSQSGVSWAAILAGGVANAALTLVLLAFDCGMGFSSVSPWANSAALEGGQLRDGRWRGVIGTRGYRAGRTA